jgi:hypothetical protein
MTPIAARLAELRKPNAPEYLDDRWYYAGFSQYLKGEAFERYNRDLADYYKASFKLVLAALQACYEEMHKQIEDDITVHVAFAEAYADAEVVLNAMKELRAT